MNNFNQELDRVLNDPDEIMVNHKEKPQLTEDIFLNLLAKKLCEQFGYDQDRIEPFSVAISDLQHRQVQSTGSSHKKDQSLLDALNGKNPGYADLLKGAAREITFTLKQTHNCFLRGKVFKLLERPQLFRICPTFVLTNWQ